MRSCRFFLAALFITAAASCDGLTADCTQAGCENGAYLSVHGSDGLPLERFHGTAMLDTGRVIAFACPHLPAGDEVYACDGAELWLSHAVGQPYLVTLISDQVQGESEVVDLEPSYRDLSPNGPVCGPTCRVAEASVVLAPVPLDMP